MGLLNHNTHRKYDSGAVGSFTHVVALQGTNYSCELEVYADGYSLKYYFLMSIARLLVLIKQLY